LLSSLQRLAKDEFFAVYLETLDDVVFEQDGSALELLQLKHHCNRAANLTDASPDLWKSFRVWMEGRANRSIPEDARLYLITTSNIGEGSSASYLMIEKRNEAKALKKLRETATTSTNQTNEPAYRLFRSLSPDAQATLVKAIMILPNAPSISDVNKALRAEVYPVARRHHLDSFLTRLEGWWYRRAVEQLIAPDTPPILSNEIQSAVDDLREQFKDEALPVDEDILDAQINSALYDNSVFVQQIRLTGIGKQRILFAIRDYYRAFHQRSRWIREDLVLVGDLRQYERRLQEEWEYQFARIADEIGDEATEQMKQEVAQKIYAWMEDSEYPIRPQVRERSITRGSFHILADGLKVGWHPEFMHHLQQVLEPQRIS
jgi:hypothetical protein